VRVKRALIPRLLRTKLIEQEIAVAGLFAVPRSPAAGCFSTFEDADSEVKWPSVSD